MLEQFKGKKVFVHTMSRACMGILVEYDEQYVVLQDKTKKIVIERKWINTIEG